MLEILRDDFQLKSVDVKFLPVFVKNASDYFREQILVHSTRGNLAAAKQAIRQYRIDGHAMGTELCLLKDDSSMPSTRRKRDGDN